MARTTIRIKKNCLPALASKVAPAARTAQRTALERMQRTAQSRARVATGAMRDHTVVVGDDTLLAQEPYSGFLNYGARSIAPDYWFSGAVEAEKGGIAAQMASSLRGALECD